MVKKIILAISLILLSELTMLLVFQSARRAWNSPAQARQPERKPIDLSSAPKTLTLSLPGKSLTLESAYLIKFQGVDEKVLGARLVGLSRTQNRPAVNAELTLADGRATHFVPDQDGQTLDLASARRQIIDALATGQEKLALAVVINSPDIRLGNLNNLGIKELLARGQSDFSGSTRSRIQNIRVGASRYHGLIIEPGEEFSFVKDLGPVDGAHGFTPELVIKPEGTVPEFGGGLCQVSTTAFRAAFFGGLPITARRNHSYAVKYYEWITDDQPRSVGLDATIYPGAQDLKFINDTNGPILIATKIEGARLYFDFYGAKDGREVLVAGPHSYDRKSSGAVKATVTRKVVKNGVEAEERIFLSNYVSPLLYPIIYEYPKPVEPPPAGGPPSSQEGQTSL